MNKMGLARDVTRFFESYRHEVGTQNGELPILYGVHVRPKENVIRSLHHINRKRLEFSRQECNRLEFVENLLKQILLRIESKLIRHPERSSKAPLLIRSRNCIESNTKYGGDSIHHSHGVWSIHPDIKAGFKQLLVPFNRKLLTKEQQAKYGHRQIYTFCPAILDPFSESVYSLLIEECYDFDLLLDYCMKHSDKYGPYNTWGMFDTPTIKKKNNNERETNISLPRNAAAVDCRTAASIQL